jgi:hypothetical protein
MRRLSAVYATERRQTGPKGLACGWSEIAGGTNREGSVLKEILRVEEL